MGGVVLILISALLLYDFDAFQLVTRLRPQFMFALLDKEPRPVAQDEIHTPDGQRRHFTRAVGHQSL
jgi:hypothetical protein